MKTILTHTYFIEEDSHEKEVMKPYPPLGLLYLSAYLKQHHFEVEVYDSTFSTYPQLISFLNDRKPEVLGIHCNLLTKYNVMKLIRHCRENGIIAILGGPDASTQVEEFLTYGADIIISGPGEEPLKAVLSALKNKAKQDLFDIPNVSFKDRRGQIVRNYREASRRHLDVYPFPDRKAIDLHKYLNAWEEHHGQRPVSLITARGCAFTCKWCSHSVYAWTHRRRKPENVIKEIKEIIEKYKPTHLWFADDVFTVNKRWIIKFQQMMKTERIFLPFECIARADKLDEELVLLLKQMGCYRIWFGAESGSQKVLDAMSRGVTKQQIYNATRWCQQHRVEAGYFVMFGYPGEEITDIYETIDFVKQQQPDTYLTTVAYPLRGTTMFKEINKDIIIPNGWESHLQRELDLKNRFTRPLYDFAIKKLASEYRKKQLENCKKQYIKKVYHSIRSIYCDYKMKQLSNIKT